MSSLLKSLSLLDIEVTLARQNYPKIGGVPDLAGINQIVSQAGPMTSLLRGFNPGFAHKLYELAPSSFDLVHNHGLWMFPNLYARKLANMTDTPLITSPRGMLEPWSLQQAKLKKSLAWILFEKKNLDSVAMFHATSLSELESIRGKGLKQPVAVVPNGMDLPDLTIPSDRTSIENKFPKLKDKQWLLFLSRLHPKKGLEVLLPCWKKLVKQFPDWSLIIAGPDIVDYRPTLDGLVDSLGLHNSVAFTGMLTGSDKKNVLENSDLFVLPSHSENFGNVIAEALAHETPVVTTTNTPWEILNEKKCGWCIDLSSDELASTLQDAMSLSQSELKEMGKGGRRLVSEEFTWNSVATKMTAAYSWILSGGSQPNCLHC